MIGASPTGTRPDQPDLVVVGFGWNDNSVRDGSSNVEHDERPRSTSSSV